MASFRQAVQAKIDALNQQVASLQSELSAGEATFGVWLDAEVTDVKSQFEAFTAAVERVI